MAMVRGMASKPGTRLKVRCFGDGLEALRGVGADVRVPFGFVMRMVLGSGWVTVSVELEMTGRMNCVGAEVRIRRLAVISTVDSVRV